MHNQDATPFYKLSAVRVPLPPLRVWRHACDNHIQDIGGYDATRRPCCCQAVMLLPVVVFNCSNNTHTDRNWFENAGRQKTSTPLHAGYYAPHNVGAPLSVRLRASPIVRRARTVRKRAGNSSSSLRRRQGQQRPVTAASSAAATTTTTAVSAATVEVRTRVQRRQGTIFAVGPRAVRPALLCRTVACTRRTAGLVASASQQRQRQRQLLRAPPGVSVAPTSLSSLLNLRPTALAFYSSPPLPCAWGCNPPPAAGRGLSSQSVS